MVGGFDATSNVAAGLTYGIPIKGTHAHAFVSAFNDLNDVKYGILRPSTGGERERERERAQEIERVRE